MHNNEIKTLPNFLVVGVMKGGTSAIAVNLPMHPDVWMIDAHKKAEAISLHRLNLKKTKGGLGLFHKEMDFFNYIDNYNLGIDLYKSFFNSNHKAIGEASPNYFCVNEKHYWGCISRMFKHVPNAKIIILLRDPITRAFSHWNMIQTTKPKWGKHLVGLSFYECVTMEGSESSALLKRSKYFDNLTRYRGTFKNVYVALSENILKDPVTEYNKIYEFLGLRQLNYNPGYRTDIHTYNYKDKIDWKSIDYLKKHFKDDVDNVKRLLPDLDYTLWNEY